VLEESGGMTKRRWIKAVTSDPPIEVLAEKKRYCGICKTQMDYKKENDAWVCRSTVCGGYLPRGYNIGPTKGEQEELVTITDPYGTMQKPFVKSILPEGKRLDYHRLRRPAEEKKAKSPVDAMKDDDEA
jgi:hypothetical protein